MSDVQELVEIGDLARQTRTAPSAIRYYEKLGLVSPDQRRGGRRRYSAAAAERVALIRLCQEVGFSLGEIRQIVDLAGRSPNTGAWTRLAEHKVQELDERIATAAKAKDLLQHGISCPHPNVFDCPHFRAELRARLAP